MSEQKKEAGLEKNDKRNTTTIVDILNHYEKPSRFQVLYNNRFFFTIPLAITNVLLLVVDYVNHALQPQVFLSHTLFIHLPLIIVTVIWLTYHVMRAQNELMGVHYKRFENLFNKMIDGCALHEIIVDDHGQPIDYRFLNANVAFEKMTGLVASQIIGKTIREVMPSVESYWIQIYGRVAMTGDGVHFENYSQSLNKYFEVTAFATGYKQFAVVFADITDKKLLDQRKTELEIEKNKNSLLTSVLANLSHDFRTPISIINTSLYLIERLEDPTKRLEKIKQIKSQAELFERFIKDVISILNLEYATTTNKTSVNINDVIKDVSNAFNHRMRKAGQTLNINIDFNIPEIEANPNQLAQVLHNLIENAINFTEEGGLICVTTNMKDDNIHIIIEDNGMGIDPTEMTHIFDKFYRVDKARSHKSGGLGLGLAIVKKIIELHQFKIDVKSSKDEGTRVDITIPMAAISQKKKLTPKSIEQVVIETPTEKERTI